MSFLNDLVNLVHHHSQQQGGVQQGHEVGRPLPHLAQYAHMKPEAAQPRQPIGPQHPQQMTNPNPQTMNTEYGGQYRGVAPYDTDQQLGSFQLQPQMPQHLGAFQPTSWNNGQVSLNGAFNQGNPTGPGVQLSPYHDLNKMRLY